MPILRRLLPPLAAVLAAACMPVEPLTPGMAPGMVAGSSAVLTTAVRPAPLPDFPILGTALPAGHTAFGNASLAALFTVMALELEGETRRAALVRYEEPISVDIEGPGADQLAGFVDRYLAELRRHTGIDITTGPVPDNLHVRLVNGTAFAATVPAADCVIAAGNLSWSAFARDPLRASSAAFARVRRIDQMTVFIPADARPHRIRACVLEELPQALGLSNDLYGLGMSSFNDDAAHLWPTKLDYLMLRVLYAPEMTSGLNRRETERRAREVLDRINPAGRGAPPLPRLNRRSLDDWSVLMHRVFTRRASPAQRRADIEKALTLVEAFAPMSPQHCHTLVTAGRLLSEPQPARALQLFDLAAKVCDTAHGVSDIRHARIRLEAACALFRLARYGEVIETAEAVWPVLAAHGQDERLARLYSLESQALDAIEPGSERTASARDLATAWNAYAYGVGGGTPQCRPHR